MSRFIDISKLKPLDAYTLTREKHIADYFEKVMQVNPKLVGQMVANIIINKKLPTSLSPQEFAKKADTLLAPKQTDTKLLDEVATKVVAANQKSVADYKSGKQNAIMFLVGQVMREMKGNADAKTVISKLKEVLK